MKPKLIIFDWDGTLADTTNPIIATFRQSFADCGQCQSIRRSRGDRRAYQGAACRRTVSGRVGRPGGTARVAGGALTCRKNAV